MSFVTQADVRVFVEELFKHIFKEVKGVDIQTPFPILSYKESMDKYGIDIPKFANEAAFLRGSGIIDTRTYYPSIPWFWRWELANYDNSIKNAKAGQPDSPTMILELQSGWFTMFGQPPFDPPPFVGWRGPGSSFLPGPLSEPPLP